MQICVWLSLTVRKVSLSVSQGLIDVVYQATRSVMVTLIVKTMLTRKTAPLIPLGEVSEGSNPPHFLHDKVVIQSSFILDHKLMLQLHDNLLHSACSIISLSVSFTHPSSHKQSKAPPKALPCPGSRMSQSFKVNDPSLK